MADFNDSLSIDVQVQLANARREYETFKREVEQTPLKIASDFSVPTKENRTFGGMPGPTGSGVEVRPSQGAQSSLNSTFGSQMQSVFVSRNIGGSMGGGGISGGLAAGPVPTAGVNSFFGDATRAMQGASVVNLMGAMSPMQAQAKMSRPSQFIEARLEQLRQAPMTRANEGAVSAEYGKLVGQSEFWRGGGVFGATVPNNAGMVTVPAGMGPRAFQPGPSAPTPGAPSVAGGGIMAGMSMSRGITTAGAGLYFAASMADRYGTQFLQQQSGFRYDSTLENAQNAYAEARGMTLGGKIGGSIVNFFAPGTANDFNTEAEAYDALRGATAQSEAKANLRANRARDAMSSNSLLRGVSRVIADSDATFRAQSAEIAQEKIARFNGDTSDLDAKSESLRKARDANINSTLSDYRATLSKGEYSLRSMRESAELRPYAAQQAGIDSSRMAAQVEFDRSSSLLSPEDRARGQSLINNQFAIESGALKIATQESNRNRTEMLRAGTLASNFRTTGSPLNADISMIGAETRSQISAINLDTSAPGYSALRSAIVASGESRSVESAYGFGFSRTQTQIGLGAESKSLDRQLARDSIGAQAFAISGAGQQRIRSLAMAGMGPEAEAARENSLKELGVLSQNYRLSFRAEQYDLQNMTPFNPRDAQNPEVAFAQIAQAKGEVSGESSNREQIQKDSMEAALESFATGTLSNLVPAWIKQALQDSLAN